MNKILLTLTLGFICSTPIFAADADVRGACESDIKALCAGIQPGGGRIKSCMQEHKDQLSSGCKSALFEQAKERQGGPRRRGNNNSPDATQ